MLKSGDVALGVLPQVDGERKERPVVLLSNLPGHGDWLACGVSSRLWNFVEDFDEVIPADDPEFSDTGLKTAAVIRLGFLGVVPSSGIMGTLGQLWLDRTKRLIGRLCDHLLGGMRD